MSRRITLPGADELFRATGAAGPDGAATDLVAPRPLSVAPAPDPDDVDADLTSRTAPAASRSRGGVRHTPRPRSRAGQGQDRRPSGRERHDEKITVYLSPEELVDLEHARLALRQDHGMAVDRGRIVREALAVVLADLEQRGDASTIVRRLRES